MKLTELQIYKEELKNKQQQYCKKSYKKKTEKLNNLIKENKDLTHQLNKLKSKFYLLENENDKLN